MTRRRGPISRAVRALETFEDDIMRILMRLLNLDRYITYQYRFVGTLGSSRRMLWTGPNFFRHRRLSDFIPSQQYDQTYLPDQPNAWSGPVTR